MKNGRYKTTGKALPVLMILFLAVCQPSLAQQFKVESFRAMPNDVSAFITPVRDLNNEACALIKVAASEDFAFSSPLGIVKRKDDVGEIWLYLPRGSRQITIKHPQWGVMRDYRFAKPLESHVTYEMRISVPQSLIEQEHDTIILTKIVVDTVAVEKRRPRLPLTSHALLTCSFHENGPSFGVMISLLRRHGMFVHVSCDLRSTGKTVETCDKEGFIGDNDIKPYYTGATRHSNYMFTAGLVHRLGNMFSLYEGLGYGRAATAWQLAESEGGGYVLNEGLTDKGLAAEAGVILSFGKLSVSASASTISGKQWQANIGLGIKISKR